MRNPSRAGCPLFFSLVLVSCSTHPLPEDFARHSTFDIVQKLRCEARDGVISSSLTRAALENTYVGYDFTFDLTENNKASGGTLEFLNPFPSGKFTLALSGGADKKRQNLRFFRIVELLEDLREDAELASSTGPCAIEGRANFVYPIAGRVGIEEVLVTYGKLRSVAKFRVKDASVFSDTITFTTKLNAGIKPTLELNSVAGQFRLTKASIDGSVERTDIHKVAIAIAPREQVKDVIVPYMRTLVPVATPSDAAGVVLELERLRARDEDQRLFENLRILP